MPLGQYVHHPQLAADLEMHVLAKVVGLFGLQQTPGMHLLSPTLGFILGMPLNAKALRGGVGHNQEGKDSVPSFPWGRPGSGLSPALLCLGTGISPDRPGDLKQTSTLPLK